MGTFTKTSVEKGNQTMKVLLISGLFIVIVGTLSLDNQNPPINERYVMDSFEDEELDEYGDEILDEFDRSIQQETGMKFSLSERTSEDSYRDITVTFPDGYTDKIILRKHFVNEEQRMNSEMEGNNEHCHYFGHLSEETEACVAMTGCIGVDDIEFSIMSSHNEGSPYFVWTKEGEVQSINIYPNDDGNLLRNKKTRSQDSANDGMMPIPQDAVCTTLEPPSAMLMKLTIGYDDLFFDTKDRDEAKVWSHIQKINTHLKIYFCHPSLGSKIQFDINPAHVHFIPDKKLGHDAFKKQRQKIFGEDKFGDYNVLLTAEMGGGLNAGTVCSDGYLAVGCAKNCAWTLSHEIGHALGMPHMENNAYPKEWDCGGDKMMGRQDSLWSSCTVFAFRELYTRLKSENNWCLKEYPNACNEAELSQDRTLAESRSDGSDLECSDGTSPIPNGNFNIQNSRNGLYLSVVNGELSMTEKNLGMRSEWSWKVHNDYFGHIVPVSQPNNALYAGQCGNGTTNYWATAKATAKGGKCHAIVRNLGSRNYRNVWRISGNRIINGHPATLFQDSDQNIFSVYGIGWSPESSTWDNLSVTNCCSTPKVFDIKNLGENCWTGCEKTQGKCNWCGDDGYCCRKGIAGNECNGAFGGVSGYECVLNPYYPEDPPVVNSCMNIWKDEKCQRLAKKGRCERENFAKHCKEACNLC